jgi:hypothetical protein
MECFIDFAYDSLNKKNEELCGDRVEFVKTDDGIIIVLADGLGSGVKANILATLTSKIAVTMLKEGANLDETVETIVRTLPTCNVRKIAYSTFSIVKILNSGKVYIAEFDNPPFVLVRNGRIVKVEKILTEIEGKKIYESSFEMANDDFLTIMSDGAIHAGVGQLLNHGWKWENIAEYLRTLKVKDNGAVNITKSLLETCNDLYAGMPGDDTTVLTIKVCEPKKINIFTGPPKRSEDDKRVVEYFMKLPGKKVICGGTTANIVSREAEIEIDVNLDSMDVDVPPTAYMEGIDLVTEGVLTLAKTVEILENYINDPLEYRMRFMIGKKNGAKELANILVNDCTHLDLIVGKAINPAHQNPDLPINLNIKQKII